LSQGISEARGIARDLPYAPAVQKVNVRQKLDGFAETWVPKVVGELNGQYVKVVKFEGEYVWHAHAAEDELFYVVRGSFDLHFRDRVVTLHEGELCVVPRGVEHKPVAAAVCEVMLFEPATTRNTGAVDHTYTIEADALEKI
jgi:mannose-6-phosphate isomerase-like protein (cupin superfamily)